VNAYKSQGSGIDFQMMVPSLVIALQDESKDVRAAGVGLLKAVAGAKGKEGDVYAVDTFYGSQSSKSYPEGEMIELTPNRKCSITQTFLSR
jgi:U3 small nucleolar RNA-associated protein 10